MAERPTRAPEIPVRTLGGLNERPSKANLRPGEFDVLEGLYPSSVGLQSRIPGKVAVDSFTGVVLQICNTQNTNGDVLYQVGENLYASTIDEIQGRVVAPSLTFNPLADEDAMSMAIIVQKETNAINGGSLDGFLSGSSVALADTFYARRLTTMLVNESTTVTTFTAAGSGAGAASSGSFVLSPGTYRISGDFVFRADQNSNNQSYIVGLYNVTSAAFEVQTGTAHPILSTLVANGTSGTNTPNMIGHIEASVTVSTTNKTYAFYQKGSLQGAARLLTACGTGAGLTATNVNGAAAPFYYAYIKILKTA